MDDMPPPHTHRRCPSHRGKPYRWRLNERTGGWDCEWCEADRVRAERSARSLSRFSEPTDEDLAATFPDA